MLEGARRFIMVEGVNKAQPLIKELLRGAVAGGNRMMDVPQPRYLSYWAGLGVRRVVLRRNAQTEERSTENVCQHFHLVNPPGLDFCGLSFCLSKTGHATPIPLSRFRFRSVGSVLICRTLPTCGSPTGVEKRGCLSERRGSGRMVGYPEVTILPNHKFRVARHRTTGRCTSHWSP